jgi:hypothetical protein
MVIPGNIKQKLIQIALHDVIFQDRGTCSAVHGELLWLVSSKARLFDFGIPPL